MPSPFHVSPRRFAANKFYADSFQLSSDDARSIVRLLGEVCALPDDHSVKKTI